MPKNVIQLQKGDTQHGKWFHINIMTCLIIIWIQNKTNNCILLSERRQRCHLILFQNDCDVGKRI